MWKNTFQDLPVKQRPSLTVRQLREYTQLMHILADHSTQIIRNYFGRQVPVKIKEDISPVTQADREVEETLRDIILRVYPDHGIIGEEFGTTDSGSEFTWVLDPIDGTKSFIVGSVTFGTLIGLLYNRQPVLGMINMPMLNSRMIGDNQKTLLDDQAVRCRNCRSIGNANLLVTDLLEVEMHHNGDSFRKVLKEVQNYRLFGDCYGYYLLAQGMADIMIDARVAPWDILPVIPVVQGAGGIISDYGGESPVYGAGAVASSTPIHPELIRMLNPSPESQGYDI